MKRFFCALGASLLSAFSFAQSTTSFIPELVFQNPVLVSGTAGQNGAVYRFSNVAAGIDATVKIAGRSATDVVLSNIDVTETGWNKAFQPQLGIAGNVCAGHNWYMDFEMRFYKAGTATKQKIKGFNVTAIDVDGDGLCLQEYLQMNKTASLTYNTPTQLAWPDYTNVACTYDYDTQNASGTNRVALGPVANYTNIDTAGKAVMATFGFADKDMIAFRYGAKTNNAGTNAAVRLNSLWFRGFTLTKPTALPIRFSAFTAAYANARTVLNWNAYSDEAGGSFAVERSANGTDFTAIATVFASEGEAPYSYVDAALPANAGTVYYRIKSAGKSSEFAYTAVKTIRIGKDATVKISVYPNPVRQSANVTLPASWQGQPVTISVYSAAGSEMQRQQIKSASQTESINMGQLPKGFYVVKAQSNGQLSEERIIRD